jgi:hypothetical protein
METKKDLVVVYQVPIVAKERRFTMLEHFSVALVAHLVGAAILASFSLVRRRIGSHEDAPS